MYIIQTNKATVRGHFNVFKANTATKDRLKINLRDRVSMPVAQAQLNTQTVIEILMVLEFKR